MLVNQELKAIFNDFFHFLLLIVYQYFHHFQSFFFKQKIMFLSSKALHLFAFECLFDCYFHLTF